MCVRATHLGVLGALEKRHRWILAARTAVGARNAAAIASAAAAVMIRALQEASLTELKNSVRTPDGIFGNRERSAFIATRLCSVELK